jgi:hypothetical protein
MNHRDSTTQEPEKTVLKDREHEPSATPGPLNTARGCNDRTEPRTNRIWPVITLGIY